MCLNWYVALEVVDVVLVLVAPALACVGHLPSLFHSSRLLFLCSLLIVDSVSHGVVLPFILLMWLV